MFEDNLPIGYYVLISAKENNVEARILGINNLITLDINNKKRLQIDVRNEEGQFINNAKVFVDDKEAYFQQDSKTYWVRQKKLKGAFVKVYTPGDTLYTSITLNERDGQRKIGQQLHEK